ncbi:hypothetical protein [Kitasatospora acidiphila]|uniref:hypothetical protein n=1 Tax=Kitasatospora acidiphila TaxID=2567942 RepID=UPI001E2F6A57|nr:hypothetical protein [Kitasatospora acidiphila]
MKPTMAAEVYTLAGTLWTCTTGRWPLDYAAIGIDHRAAGPDGIRDAIALGTVPLSTKPDWSAVGYVLRDVLLAKAADRPTAIELAATLEGL